MPEVRVNGVTLYYEERGSGDAILGLHGAGSSAAFWADAAEALASRGRTIVYDRRGHSRSERPEPYVTDVHVQADDAAALIDALAAAPAIVIGRSYGADVAVDLALRHPERVRALVLMEGLELISEEGARWLSGLVEQGLAAAAADVSTVGETVIRGVLGDEGWSGLPAQARQVFVDNGPAIAAELRGGFLDVTAGELAAVDRPTLLVTGKDSVPVYEEVTRALAAAMPSARIERVAGGHLIDPAHPAVLSFVDEVLAGRA